MTTLDHSNTSPQFKKQKLSPRLLAYYFYITGVLVAMIAAAVLVTAQAQTNDIQTKDVLTAEAGFVKARYSATDIARAFGFIDANQDGKMSREEASGFRNIAKHFDAADTNKDGNLSIEEFTNALNRP